MAILRLLCAGNPRGVPLTLVAQRLELAVSTAHRLLAQLIEERLVRQVGETRGYALGPLAFELGLAAAQQFDVRRICRPIMEALALEVGDTVYLSIRSGEESVCMDMVEGPSAIRVVTLRIGSRRPLGLGAGGLAILAWLKDEERAQVLDKVAAQIEEQWQVSAAVVRKSVAEARRLGFAAIRNRINAGVTAVGVPLWGGAGHVIGAVSVAAVNARLSAARIKGVAEQLRRASREFEAALRTHGQSHF